MDASSKKLEVQTEKRDLKDDDLKCALVQAILPLALVGLLGVLLFLIFACTDAKKKWLYVFLLLIGSLMIS